MLMGRELQLSSNQGCFHIYAVRKKVEEELQRLERDQVKCSDWAASIVPVLKPNGQVQIYTFSSSCLCLCVMWPTGTGAASMLCAFIYCVCVCACVPTCACVCVCVCACTHTHVYCVCVCVCVITGIIMHNNVISFCCLFFSDRQQQI